MRLGEDVDPERVPANAADQVAALAALTGELDEARKTIHRLRQLLDAAPVGVVLYADTGAVEYVNERVLQATGTSGALSFEAASSAFVHPSDLETYARAVTAARLGIAAQFRIRTSDTTGKRMRVEAILEPIVDGGVPNGAIALYRDVTEEVERDERLLWFKAIADLTTDIVGIAAPDSSILYINPAGVEFFGLDDSAVPRTLHAIFKHIPVEFHDTLMTDAYAAVLRGNVWQGDVALLRDGDLERHPMSAVVIGVHDDQDELVALAVTYRDLTERHKLQAELAHAASHDALTGLASRQELFRVLEMSLDAGESTAVLFFDLDDFKVVNDSLGHSVGDEVLTQLAHRIATAARETDVVGRLGGDEFLVLCRDVSDPREATEIANRVLASVRLPMKIGMRHHTVTGSIGIALSGSQNASAVSLIQEADIAMYRAKRAGRRQSVLFDDSMRVEAVDRLELEQEVRLALDRDEFELYFQPLSYFDRDMVQNFEALIRWNHPRYGLLSPVDFLPLVDKVGLTGAVGGWVFRTASAAASVMRVIEPETCVGVNVDPDQIRQPGFVDALVAAMDAAGVPGSALTIEITEHAMMDDIEQTRTVLEQLRVLGVSIAVDDFGTGYSNLDLLRRLPVDYLKIDQSFIARLGIEAGDTQLVRMIVGLSQELGIGVVAEGVESQMQEDELRRLGCRIGQGYLYSRPLSLDDALELLRAQQVEPALP